MSSKKRGGLSKREYAILTGGGDKSSINKEKSSSLKLSKPNTKKESKKLAEAQREYLASLTPSQQEKDALTANQNLLLGQELKTKSIQSEPVASVFQERGIDRLNQDVSEKVIPLKYQIAALQSEREGRREAAAFKEKSAGEAYNRKITENEYKNKLKTDKYNLKQREFESLSKVANKPTSKPRTPKAINPLDQEYKILRNKQLEEKLKKPTNKKSIL